MNSTINKLKEIFSSTWLLLNDTTIFLTRAKALYKFEKDIRRWRKLLKSRQNDQQVYKEVKKEIIELRKTLRLQGYDLRLGSKDIVTLGFKSDDAPLHGFKRIVLFITGKNIYYYTGTDNHLQLVKSLGMQLGIDELNSYPTIHNLWFRWNNNILEICGADSESLENFERLKSYIKTNKLYVLKKLNSLS